MVYCIVGYNKQNYLLLNTFLYIILVRKYHCPFIYLAFKYLSFKVVFFFINSHIHCWKKNFCFLNGVPIYLFNYIVINFSILFVALKYYKLFKVLDNYLYFSIDGVVFFDLLGKDWNYCLFENTFQISPTLIGALGKDTEGATFVINFVLAKIQSNICYFHSEPILLQDTVDLFADLLAVKQK